MFEVIPGDFDGTGCGGNVLVVVEVGGSLSEDGFSYDRIGVDVDDDFSSGTGKTAVEGFCLSFVGVLLEDDEVSLIVLSGSMLVVLEYVGKFFDDLDGSIGAAVVDNDDFYQVAGVGLGDEGVEAVGDVLFFIVAGNDDADGGKVFFW